MLEEILKSVKGDLGGQLMDKLGMTDSETDKSFDVLGGSLQNIIGQETKGGGLSTLTNLFSDEDNSKDSDSLLDKLGGSLMGDLVGKAGLSQTKASGFKDLVLPLVISLISKKVGGNSDLLGSLLGGGQSSGGLGKIAGSALKSGLGGLFKK